MNMYSQHSQDRSSPRRIIGLTGGIGMGKTTVSQYLAANHQLPVLDADLYARSAVEPGSALLQEVIERYGLGILLPNGKLDRRRLGEIAFSSPPERLWLEQRIHPYVHDRFVEAINTLSDPILVLVVPLLFEARMLDLVTEVWVVYCSRERQVEHLKQREGESGLERDRLSPAEIHARINSQMPIEKKISCADVVLDNSSTLEALYQQVDLALQQRPAKSAGR